MASGSHCPIGIHLVNGRRDGAVAPGGADVLWYHTGQLWVSDLRSTFPCSPLVPSRPLKWLKTPLIALDTPQMALQTTQMALQTPQMALRTLN